PQGGDDPGRADPPPRPEAREPVGDRRERVHGVHRRDDRRHAPGRRRDRPAAHPLTGGATPGCRCGVSPVGEAGRLIATTLAVAGLPDDAPRDRGVNRRRNAIALTLSSQVSTAATNRMSSSNPSPTTDLEPESRHGAIFEIAIDRVRPAVVNDQIYRPVDPDDPDVRSLARSIDAHGQLDEIVL